MRSVLDELRVVGLGGGTSALYCAKLFADLGADVVHVARPGPAAARDGRTVHLGTNSRRAALDPADDAERAAATALVEVADLVIESDDGDGLASWGIDWEDLHRRAPGLTVVHISGFGSTGPYAGYRWSDLVVQAVAGSLLLQGHPSSPPLRLPAEVAMYFVGHHAALGGLSALLAAERGGPGSYVDCAAVEALATMPSRQAPLLGYHYRDRTSTGFGAGATTTLIPTGVFPCADGFVAMMSTAQQLTEMLEVLGDPAAKEAFAHPDAFDRPETKEALDVAVYTWLAARTRAEATAEAQRAGWPLAGVLAPGEVLGADHLHQRGFWVHSDDPALGAVDLPGPWCRFGEGGWALRRVAPAAGQDTVDVKAEAGAVVAQEERPERPLGVIPARPASPPLEGVRVIDLTVVWSGPYATMLLADLGAEVIRVENPFVLPPTTKGYHPRPILSNPGNLGALYAPARPGVPDRPWNRHAMNNSLARNKLSVTIDTRRSEGHELLLRLVERSDVFIDNFKAEGLSRIGIDVDELRRRNPRLVVVRLPPTGTTGDWSSYTGFGAQFDGLSGFASVCGHLGSDPTGTPATTYMDAASGPAGAMAVLAALRYRAATGRGQYVELSQSENIINHLGDVMVDTQIGVETPRRGNRDRWRAPQGLYRCVEEGSWLAVTVTDDRTWRALAEIVGGGALAADDRFAEEAARRAAHDELDALIEEWTATVPLMEAFARLQAAGVPAGPLLDDAAFTDDPHVQARGWLQPLHSGDVGTHPHPGHAFSGVAQAWRRGSPTLGEDNEYVYKQLLEVTDEDYERYAVERILATDYLKADGTPW